MASSINTVIEISSQYLKIIQTIRKSAEMQISFSHVSDINGLSDDQIGTHLLKICQKNRLSGRSVIGVIGRQNAIIRFLNLPSLDSNEIKQMVELQAFQQVPYARNEVVMDFVSVSRDDVSGYTRVMVVIVPNETFTRHWSIYEKAKLKVDHISISTFGLAAWTAQDDPLLVSAILDMDEEGTELCICQAGKILATRQFSFNSKDFNKEVGIDLIHQLELTFSNYKKEQAGPTLSKIVVMGPKNFLLEELLQSPQQQLSLPFETRPAVLDVPRHKSIGLPLDVTEGKVSQTAISGLALMSRYSGINLVSSDIKESKSKKRVLLKFVKTGGLVLTACLFVALSALLPSLKENSQLSSLNKQLSAVKSKASEVEAMAKQIKDIEELVAQKIIFSNIVRELSTIIPGDLVLVKFSIADRKIIYEGYSSERESIDAFEDAMRQSSLFHDVQLEYINKRVTQVGEVNYFKINSRIMGSHAQNQQ